MFKTIINSLFTLFLLFSSTVFCSASTKEEQPNIIYILADDLGYGDLSCYNEQGKLSTPALDKMAKKGIMFTDVHTSSSVCTPTRYGILTGRYNWRSTLKQSVLGGYSKALIPSDRATVASMLKSQGYSTAFIGKWHLGWDWSFNGKVEKIDNLNKYQDVDYTHAIANGPADLGFDYSFGFCGSLDMPPYVWVENTMPTMVPTKETVNKDSKACWRNGVTADDFDHQDVLQDLTDRAVSYITDKSSDDKPFFLYFPLPAPHTPILPTEEFLGKSKTNEYGDFVLQVDDVVRQIRASLKKNGIAKNTLLVFTSDNGCSPKADFEELKAFDHDPSYSFRGHKADIYEGGHRVPFIVEWPQRASSKVISDQTICTTDFYATCAHIVGKDLQDDEAEDSYSMLPIITDNSKAEIREFTVHHSINGSFAIRQGDWKLCLCPGSGGWSYPTPKDIKKGSLELPPMQLFNLKEDIGETTNLLDQHPEKAASLKEALIKIIMDGRSTTGSQQTNEGMENWKQLQLITE